MARKTFNIYLAKPDITDFNDVLSENAQDKLTVAGTTQTDLHDLGDGGRLYIFSNIPHTPKWLQELCRELNFQTEIRTRSACALLAFRKDERIFVRTFAHGWMYLDPENVEGDFGLRVTLNCLDESKLKRLDRSNLANAMRDSAMSTFQRDFTAFGIDEALDHIRRLTGRTKDDVDAETMSGATSLKMSGDFEFTDLVELASQALEAFTANDYQETAFQIIDVVAPIVDLRLSRRLDAEAASRIRDGHNDFELGLPIDFDDDGVAYKFVGANLRGQFADLLLNNYIFALGENLAAMNAESLRKHKIVAILDDPARPNLSWSIKKALIGSLVFEGGRYAVNEGEWYRVDEQFRQSIDATFNRLKQDHWQQAPRPLRRIYDQNRNAKYEREEDYNLEIAPELGLICLDQTSVQVPEVPRSGFEPCDLLDIEGKRLIHVKKNSRRSSILSHFFKQGTISARNFSTFPDAWNQLFQIVEDRAGEESRIALEAKHDEIAIPWTVEYWLADSPRADGVFNIPFFSKISLRDEDRNLTAMGYQVNVRFIGLPVNPA